MKLPGTWKYDIYYRIPCLGALLFWCLIVGFLELDPNNIKFLMVKCCTSVFLCNFLPADASIAPKPDEKFENKKLERTEEKTPQQASIRIKDSEQGKLEEIEIESWS